MLMENLLGVISKCQAGLCDFVMSVIWWLLVDGEGLGENLLLPLCGTVLVRWEGCWYQVLASWPINDDCGKLV